MKALKVVVIGMGVFLILGFVALFVQWNQKRGAKIPEASPTVATAATVAEAAEIALPDGSRILEMASGERFIDLLVAHPDGTRAVYQIRRNDGRVAGIVAIDGIPQVSQETSDGRP